MIKNLKQQNKLLSYILSASCLPHNLHLLSRQVSSQTSIKNLSTLTHHLTFNFASDYKQRSQYSPQQSKKSNQSQKQSKKPFQKVRPSQKQLRRQQQQFKKSFNFSITDPQMFIDYINNKCNIQDAVKLMNRILSSRSLTKDEFQMSVWKKYSYYVYVIGEKEQAEWETEMRGKKHLETGRQQRQNQEEDQDQQDNHKSRGQEQQKIGSTTDTAGLPDNHKISRMAKTKRLRIQFLSRITQLHERFKGELHSHNVTKTFNKFVDFYVQKQQWYTLSLADKVSLLESLSSYNIKKAKTLFLKRRESLFLQPKDPLINRRSQEQLSDFESDSVIKVLQLMSKLEINDTAMFEKCIDLLYGHVDKMNLMQIELLTFLLGKSHKFINKDFLLKVRNRFGQLINQFDDAATLKVLHIVSSFSMIEKNMRLASIYFEPLDEIYQRIFPIFDSVTLSRLRSKNLSTISSALRRSQFFDESVLNALVFEAMKRQIFQFSQNQQSNSTKFQHNRQSNRYSPNSTISIQNLNQIFFALASFNYRNAEFMSYFVDLLKIVQAAKDPQQYISYPSFSRLLWSICVICNDKQIQQLLPLMEHFYRKAKEIEPYEATNFYYCYLLLKRKYLISQIRFQNDKVQQYLSGPKHEVQISQIQKEIHQHLLNIGIPSLMEYNLNNVICDIYIPKLHSLEHLIIEVHGFHHFCRNVKRLNGSTVLKEKIIENEGYQCFYISLDEWLIAEDKEQFLKDFFSHIIHKKHQQKQKKKLLEESVRTLDQVQRKGRRVLQFKRRKPQAQYAEIQQNQSQNPRIANRRQD